jgi:hypothetical protein
MRVARPRTLRRGCASAQRTVRAVRSTHRGPSTGGVAPGRFRGVWLHRSPPRPSMHGPFGVHRGPRGPYDRGARHAKACVRDPPDLDADSPVASRSMRSDLPAGLPLLGLSKDRPSIVPNQRVRRPGSASPRFPSGKSRQLLPRAVRVVSHHLDGLFLSDRAGLLRPAPDPGVHRVSSRRETGSSRCGFCPSKLSLRRQRRIRAPPFGSGVSAGPRHRSAHRWTTPFTACLASSPFFSVLRADGLPSHARRGHPRRLPGAGASRPCSIFGSVAVMSVATHEQPGAPLGLASSTGRFTCPFVPLAEERPAGHACL